MRLIAVVVAITAAGCAAHTSAGFSRAKDEGDRAYSAGRFAEAASSYERAAESADRPWDRTEALYLEACAYEHGRAWDRARQAYARLIREAPESDRGRRATFDLAALELEHGNSDTGYALLLRALVAHPNDGMARRAFVRYLEFLDRTGADKLGFLRRIAAPLATTELDENVRYAMAQTLEQQGELEQAKNAYLECTTRHPYPKGSLFDDALFRASLIDERLGRPERAVQDLERMLSVRESSSFGGSYERPRFAEARFRIAVLYRDKLGDRAAARRAFHAVYVEHATSTLRDDALWEEAKLARDDGDLGDACSLMTTLTKELPGSRYAPCAKALCPTANATLLRCHAYVTRENSIEH